MGSFTRVSAAVLVSIAMAWTVVPGLQGVVAAQRRPKTRSDSVIHIKFKESAAVAVSGEQFVSQAGQDVAELNTSLSSRTASRKERLFAKSREEVAARRNNLRAEGKTDAPDLNGYYRIKLQPGADINKTISELSGNDAVETVYAEPLAPPPPATADYSAKQRYMQAAPTGMGVNAVVSQTGGKGGNVQVADIEYSWNTSHEDIAGGAKPVERLANGTAYDPFNDVNHGTATLGTILAKRNSVGVNGESPASKFYLVNASNLERDWDLANAIDVAASRLSAGDVMILEQQAWGPDGSTLVPAEWIPAVYDAIKLATASGIIVIEPAANGGANLDDAVYGTTFPSGKADSGALMVGAGAACGTQAARSRMYFSNYGRRVNVQGYGECVTTTGYGDLFNGGVNRTYTSQFAGTSSAAATIGGAVAVMSSIYEARTGKALTPALARSLLATTGSAQNNSVNPGNLGPLPNVQAALAAAQDTRAPSVPTGLTATLNANNKVVLRWTGATDNVGVTGYQIYRNGAYFKTVTAPSYTDTSVVAGTSYTYKVRAYDARQNYSAFSAGVTIRTRAQ